MKKVLTVAALIGAISLAGIQAVSAHGGRGYNTNYGNDYCGSYNTEERASTDQDLAAIEKFRDETSASRKAIVVKRSELNALLRNDNPDEKKVAKLTGDLYDIEAELEAKAEEAGVRNRYSYDHGPNMMRGYGGGRGGHMMGW